MRKLLNFLIALAVLIFLGWALWRGLTHRPGGETAEPKSAEGAAPDEEKPESYTVTLEKEKWQALGIEKDQPEHAEQRPQRMAFGRVLDPTPLVTLDSDLASAEAALAASRAESERSQKLLAAGESTSRKNAEAAEAQFRSDEIRLAGLQRRAALEWGSDLAGLEAAARRALIDAIVRGGISLVRVDAF